MTDAPTFLANVAGPAATQHDIQAILGVLTGMVAIVMGFGLGMLALWLDYRKKRDIFQLHHAERMAAIEKGIEVPPLPPEFFQTRRSRASILSQHPLRRGLMWLLVGAAVTAALYFQPDLRTRAWWGLVLVAGGAGDLLFYALAGRHQVSAAFDTAAPTTTTRGDEKSNTRL